MNAVGFDFSTLGLYHERLCLDFSNTASRHNDPDRDHLTSYADLVSWGVDVDLLGEEQAQRLSTRAARRPAEAAAAFRKAVELREAIFAIVSEVSEGREPGPAALALFNDHLAEAMTHLQLVPAGAGVRWTWTGGEDDLERVLWPVAWSMAEFLLSDDRQKVRVCASETCDWVFLDTSRNHSRRWCSMESCGNRAKARRHYARGRSQSRASHD